MNKKILLSLIVIFMVLVAITVGIVFGRRKNYAKNELDLETIKFIDDTNISMKIKDGSLTRTSATIVIEDKNKSDTFGTGEPYKIEKKEDGKWKELDPLEPVAWIEIWYTSREDGSFTQNLNWKDIYGELQDGEYRIVKKVLNKSNNIVLYAEFKIEGKMKVTYTYNLHDESLDVEIVDKELIDLINDNIFNKKLENCYDIDLSIRGNYKVNLGNNVYFSFDGYSENGYVMITKDTKTFLTKIDSKILKQIIDTVDIKLTEKSKIFNTSIITIKNKEGKEVNINRKTAVEYLLNNCKYVYTKEINYEPNLVRPDYEIDFNNGTRILKYENKDKGYFLKDGVLGEIYCLNIMDEFLNIAINYMEERIKMLDSSEITIVSPEKTINITDKYKIEEIVTPIIFSNITTPDWLKEYDIKEEYDKGIKVKISEYEFLIPGIRYIGNRYLIDKDGNLNLCFSIMNADKNIKEGLN